MWVRVTREGGRGEGGRKGREREQNRMQWSGQGMSARWERMVSSCESV